MNTVYSFTNANGDVVEVELTKVDMYEIAHAIAQSAIRQDRGRSTPVTTTRVGGAISATVRVKNPNMVN